MAKRIKPNGPPFDANYYAAKAAWHAHNAKIGFYIACVGAALAVINVVLVIAGVYGR